ncbi:MAG: hypothetical protein ACR2HX_22715 [Pyrinomonadaceae bacterium]
MTNHEITKPKLFISHATSDGEFANAVKQEIEKVFANGVDVFCRLEGGTIHFVELHWYEAHGIGRKKLKIKSYLD